MKKLISALAALVLGASLLTVPAFAASGDVQTYGALCPDCNRGEIIKTTSDYTPWRILYDFDCKTDPTQKDVHRERIQYVSWKCTYCSLGDTIIDVHEEDYCPH